MAILPVQSTYMSTPTVVYLLVNLFEIKFTSCIRTVSLCQKFIDVIIPH